MIHLTWNPNFFILKAQFSLPSMAHPVSCRPEPPRSPRARPERRLRGGRARRWQPSSIDYNHLVMAILV